MFIEGDQTGNMVVDMGASTTLVNSKFAPQSACTGREVYMIGPGKPTQHYPVAKVHLKAKLLESKVRNDGLADGLML